MEKDTRDDRSEELQPRLQLLERQLKQQPVVSNRQVVAHKAIISLGATSTWSRWTKARRYH